MVKPLKSNKYLTILPDNTSCPLSNIINDKPPILNNNPAAIINKAGDGRNT